MHMEICIILPGLFGVCPQTQKVFALLIKGFNLVKCGSLWGNAIGHLWRERGREEGQFCAGWILVEGNRGGFLEGTHDERFEGEGVSRGCEGDGGFGSSCRRIKSLKDSNS